ncbi:MAG: ROK family transcriptional regulator [Firmicutes bacterium]|nr:ROK family transcriptional regulator [Bacillota bacterium]
MASKLSSNTSDVRRINRLLVRDIIRKQGPICRSDIAKVAGLTPPTVTNIVSEMLAQGIVEEVGYGESTGGRRPVMLVLNPNAGFILAAGIQRSVTRVALMDLSDNVLARRDTHVSVSSPYEMAAAIRESFESLLGETGIPKEKILWCGVASPGLVNPDLGVVETSSNLAWKKVPFAHILSENLSGIPVHIENISNAAALGEKAYGIGKGYPNLIYLNVSIGIGAGIIIDNSVFRGSRGYAGEIGHVPMTVYNGPQCACGREGCLEAFCGVPAVIRRVKAQVSDEEFKTLGVDKDSIEIPHLTKPPLLGIPAVKRIMDETGHLIGIAIAHLVSLFDTEMVILGGELGRVEDAFLETVMRSARDHSLVEFAETIRVVRSTMHEQPELMGAYVLAMEEVFALEDWDYPRAR